MPGQRSGPLLCQEASELHALATDNTRVLTARAGARRADAVPRPTVRWGVAAHAAKPFVCPGRRACAERRERCADNTLPSHAFVALTAIRNRAALCSSQDDIERSCCTALQVLIRRDPFRRDESRVCSVCRQTVSKDSPPLGGAALFLLARTASRCSCPLGQPVALSRRRARDHAVSSPSASSVLAIPSREGKLACRCFPTEAAAGVRHEHALQLAGAAPWRAVHLAIVPVELLDVPTT